MESFNQILEAVKEYCKPSVTMAAYNLWLSGLEPVSFSGDSAVISTSSDFIRGNVENRYLSLLKEAFEAIIGYDIELSVISRDSEEYASIMEKQAPAAPAPSRGTENSAYTFENFIIGADNRFAHAAAQAVAANPSNAYNPLFIHGASGLGKTHLLLAIKNSLEKNRPDLKVVYIGCEAFTNELITAIRLNTTDSFREKYRNVDVLLVDDVQFIAGKESTQEEFFYTFNALHDAHKQIVLASDRPPKEIKALAERLRNRFEWGLMADVKPPDLETRISIIYSKASDMGFTIPQEVAQYVAKQLKTDIRQLEGAVKKLYAFSLMDGSEPTLEIAQSAIQDIVNETMPWPSTVEKIISEVGRTFNVSSEDLRGPKQKADVSLARQIAMYIIREVTGNTMEKIGDEFNRNHATVVYAISKVENLIETDSRSSAIVQDIIKNCRQ